MACRIECVIKSGRHLLRSVGVKSVSYTHLVRIENIEELSSNIIKFEEDYAEEASLSNFLEEISLQTDIDNYDACLLYTSRCV